MRSIALFTGCRLLNFARARVKPARLSPLFSAMSQTTVVEVGRFIDEQPFSRYQLLTAVLCSVLVFTDGFDAQSMGFVAPALAAQLHLTRGALGPLLSSG